LWVIVAVLVITLMAVVGAAYWLFRQPLALLGMLGDALVQVGRGDFSHRIRLVRRDELGRLFVAFNQMSSALEARHRKEPSAPAPVASNPAKQPTVIMSPSAAKEDR